MDLIVVGCQSGDEGKGKFTDVLAAGAYAVVRYQAGPHTGHTVTTQDGEFKFIQVPAGAVRGAIGVLGNGCVIEPLSLLEEIARVETQLGRQIDLRISHSAHVVMPYHPLEDEGLERLRGTELATSKATGFSTGSGQLGSTKRGVGPCRADKMARIGIRMVDLLDEDVLRARLSVLVPMKTRLLQEVYGLTAVEIGGGLDVDELVATYRDCGGSLAPYLDDVSVFLERARAEGRYLVYEGAQSLALDVEHGTYPYCSSGYSAAGGVTVGTGSPPSVAFETVGVAKAYMVQVGGGPLPTELFGDIADYLVKRGREIGTVTGRKRRVGWLDLAFLRRSVRIEGIHRLCVTNLDVLAGLEQVKVSTHYLIDGEPVLEYPVALRDATKVEPVFETLVGWPECDWDEIVRDGLGALPPGARSYLDFVQEQIGVTLLGVSVGPKRDQTILVDTPVPSETAVHQSGVTR